MILYELRNTKPRARSAMFEKVRGSVSSGKKHRAHRSAEESVAAGCAGDGRGNGRKRSQHQSRRPILYTRRPENPVAHMSTFMT
jgi:hypothetical protein